MTKHRNSNSMDKPSKFYAGILRFTGVLSLALAGILLYSTIESQRTFPAYDELVYFEGEITSYKKDEYGVNFSISSHAGEFRYYSKGRAMGRVWAAITSGVTAKVGTSKDYRRTVYELEVDGDLIRNYDEIRSAYEADNKVGYWLVPTFCLMGFFLWWSDSHKRSNARKPERF